MNRRGRALTKTAERRRERCDGASLSIGNPQANDREGKDRYEDCANYRSCLDFAIRKMWDDFSCKKCEDFDVSTEELIIAARGISASMINSRLAEPGYL